MKITFMGAGSTVFARNVIGDCMCAEALRDSVFALYDIDPKRLEESRTILEAMRKAKGGYDSIEQAAEEMGGTLPTVYVPNEENGRIYDELYSEYRRLHDYFGRGENDVMKRLKDIRRRQRA